MNSSLSGKLGTLIYRSYIKHASSKNSFRRFVGKALEYVRKMCLYVADPAVVLTVRGKRMCLPLSHDLPICVARHPNYDSVLERLAAFLRERDGSLTCIDVGANVGDSISFCHRSDDDNFLGIEGNEHFTSYLASNTRNIKNVKFINVICSSGDGVEAWSSVRKAGTARIVEDGRSRSVKKSLDTIVRENPEFEHFNFLKIDTDGHDFEVIRGGRESIARNAPAVLFECDPFDNERFAEDFQEVVESFKNHGYTTALAYDNFGYLFCKFNLDDPNEFKFPLIYMMISNFWYFDILMMKAPDIDGFYASELSYFLGQIPSGSLRRAASAVAAL